MLVSSPAADETVAEAVPAPADCKAIPAEEIVCHCLQVTVSTVRAAVAAGGCRSVREVLGVTEAGGGCTACHRRIDELIVP